MIALDTHILARFYVDDPGDPDARKQRPLALRVMEGPSIFVPATVPLELEWVLRVMEALDAHVAGLDFADALHLCASRHCDALITFDDKRFARRAQRLGLKPAVEVAG